MEDKTVSGDTNLRFVDLIINISRYCKYGLKEKREKMKVALPDFFLEFEKWEKNINNKNILF